MICKICGKILDSYEDKICDDCFERQSENFEDLEITETEEIFGSERDYWRWKNG